MESELDNVFAQVAQRCGGVEPLLDAFFGFLHRRTDFYVEFEPSELSTRPTMGFPSGTAQKLVQKNFSKYPIKKYVGQSDDLPETTKTLSNSHEIKPNDPKPETTTITKDGLQLPVGNGGFGPNYYWTQSLKDISVYIDTFPGCKGRDVTCKITSKHIELKVQDELILNGILEDAVIVDESMWTIAVGDNSCPQIVLSLDKSRKTWWKHVFVGHPEIDTTKVDSTQNISEYDEATQAAIRKIVAEQRDKVKVSST